MYVFLCILVPGDSGASRGRHWGVIPCQGHFLRWSVSQRIWIDLIELNNFHTSNVVKPSIFIEIKPIKWPLKKALNRGQIGHFLSALKSPNTTDGIHMTKWKDICGVVLN